MHRRVPPRPTARLAAIALALLVAGAAPAAAADPPDPDAARALRAVAELRRRIDPAGAPVEDTVTALTYRERPALEVKGRVAGALRDLAHFDLGSGAVVSLVWFPHASTRKAGEAIVSLSEASSRADAHQRALFPGAELALEGVQRHRASGAESVYYEAGFAAPAAEVPFLKAPVRLLLDASTGNLFRLEADPEWFAPPRLSRAHLSRKAAEKIAAAALRAQDLAPLFGAGSTLGAVAAAELFVVRPNEWLGPLPGGAAGEARVAWVVPFTVAGDPTRCLHRLFVDAATGRILGGAGGARPGGAAR